MPFSIPSLLPHLTMAKCQAHFAACIASICSSFFPFSFLAHPPSPFPCPFLFIATDRAMIFLDGVRLRILPLNGSIQLSIFPCVHLYRQQRREGKKTFI
jgi:hypothetical protein